MPYVRFLNAVAKARRPSPIRQLTELLQKSPPTMISMATGMPNAEQFPFHEASFTLKDGNKVHISPSEMKNCLQYQATPGLPELRSWLKTMQKTIHNPPTWDLSGRPEQMDLMITTGSQHGMATVCDMLVTHGDKVLTANPLYSGTIAIMKPLGAKFIDIKTDAHGIIPEHLSEVMSAWPDKEQPHHSDSVNIPKLLYCVPNGDNPTGAGLTYERKAKIYAIARRYNLLILEDDPYYFLQFNKPRGRSFLSMDVDGRVLRFDSFSKMLSAGIRVGFVTGPKALLEKVNYNLQASVLHTSAVSQMIVYKLLEHWGLEEFLRHTEEVSDFYQGRKDVLLAAANEHLQGLAEWHEPSGGMFFWLKLLGIKDSHDLIMNKAREKEVLFVPGSAFTAHKDEKSQYVRACYSLATDEQMFEGMRRLAELIKEHQGKL
ncbi:kynurenine/alpha-aminoadipate aminotransferase, mitochondrial-like [Amphiura filiformis]|uniref:kynurenine/alpha-aminoadipate aminotransferase, mitochondrial-like n=1 Tax=Amphiura filiformis TaxID=82378 RepID=UPI003B21BEBD